MITGVYSCGAKLKMKLLSELRNLNIAEAYIAQQSLSLDLQLLYRTVGAVVTGRGAY